MQFRQIILKQNTFLLFITLLCLFSLWSCGPVEDSTSGTGLLSFNIVYHDGIDGDLRSERLEAAKIDCIGQGITDIEAKVYDADDKHLADGGPWNCDAGEGKISHVPAGSDRTVVVLGKDAEGNVIFSGQRSGITVSAGSKNNAGTIECNRFVPNLSAPADDAVVRRYGMELQWEDVAGATEYSVFISQNEDMSDPVIEDASTTETSYTPSGLIAMTTYYWRVFAVDMDGNRGIDSQIRSFMVDRALPDTGQTNSYTNTKGEDSYYTINPPAYTKLDASGNVLDDSAKDWAMVLDEITGLTWEKKTLSEDDIHYAEKIYTWQGAQDDFIAQLNNDNFGGYSDWRLPTIKELFILADKGQLNPAVDLAYFENINVSSSCYYWSITTYQSESVNDQNRAWVLTFRYGDITPDDKDDLNRVIAVRDGQTNGQTDSTLQDNGDGTVTDRATGLMWQQNGDSEDRTWEQALGYCEDLGLADADKDKWRLPNINELQSIVDYSTREPAIDTELFPNVKGHIYWSSTTYPDEIAPAWNIAFTSGDLEYHSSKTTDPYIYAICVRSAVDSD